jgi:hypothetical protein
MDMRGIRKERGRKRRKPNEHGNPIDIAIPVCPGLAATIAATSSTRNA